MGTSTFWGRGIALIAWCVVLRLIFWAAAGAWEPAAQERLLGDSDSRGYHLFALRLLSGEGFVRPVDAPRLPQHLSRWYPGEPEALWLPGYPAFLAWLYGLFGASLTAPLLVQIALSGWACGLLMAATRRLFGERAALWAGTLFAHEPVSIWLSCSIMSEAAVIPLVALCVYALTRLSDAASLKRQLLWITVLGLSWALSVWMRPGAAALAWATVVCLGIWGYRVHGVRRAFVWAAGAAVVYYLIMLPWYWRNYTAFGAWSLSTAGAYNFLEGFKYRKSTEDAQRAEDLRLFQAAYQRVQAEGVDPERLNPFERARYWQAQAIEELRRNPSEALRVHTWRVMSAALQGNQAYWRRLLGDGNDRYARLLALYSRLYALAFWMASLWGLYWVWRYGAPPARAIAWIVAALAAISMLILVNNPVPRSRFTAVILLTPVVAAGIARTR